MDWIEKKNIFFSSLNWLEMTQSEKKMHKTIYANERKRFLFVFFHK